MLDGTLQSIKDTIGQTLRDKDMFYMLSWLFLSANNCSLSEVGKLEVKLVKSDPLTRDALLNVV